MKPKNLFLLTPLVLLSISGLTACEGAKESLGIGVRNVPDEFAVIKNEPLTLPPNYKLSPPHPGAERPQHKRAETKAKEAITGHISGTENAGSLTQGESSLLKQAGANKADPDIRNAIDSKRRKLKKEEIPVARRIFGLYDEEPPASVVDANKESERLRGNMQEGEPVTKGETPIVED